MSSRLVISLSARDRNDLATKKSVCSNCSRRPGRANHELRVTTPDDPGRHPGGPPPRHAPALDAGRPPGGPRDPGLSDADLTSNFPLLFDRLIKGLEGESPPPTMPESREHAATRKRQGIGLPTLR